MTFLGVVTNIYSHKKVILAHTSESKIKLKNLLIIRLCQFASIVPWVLEALYKKVKVVNLNTKQATRRFHVHILNKQFLVNSCNFIL